jgi:hypothetical protein
MPIAAECRKNAAQCVAEARKKSRHRTDLIKLARAWLRLARQMERIAGSDNGVFAGRETKPQFPN